MLTFYPLSSFLNFEVGEITCLIRDQLAFANLDVKHTFHSK